MTQGQCRSGLYHHDLGRDFVDDAAQPFFRISRIEGDVSPTRLRRRKHGDQLARSSGQRDSHACFPVYPQGAQAIRHLV